MPIVIKERFLKAYRRVYWRSRIYLFRFRSSHKNCSNFGNLPETTVTMVIFTSATTNPSQPGSEITTPSSSPSGKKVKRSTVQM